MNDYARHLSFETGSPRREKIVKFLTHVICLGMLFVLPELLSSTGKPFRSVPELKLGVYAKALIFIVVFYINYYFIIGRSLAGKRTVWTMIGWNILVIGGALTLLWIVSRWMQPYWDEAWRIKQAAKGITAPVRLHHHHTMGWIDFLKFFSRDFVMLVLTIGLSVALKLSDTWVHLSRRAERLQAARRQEELQNLKSQLNPHFLFNTLNSIYALIAVSPPKAQDAVHELSGMLRYVLYDDRKEVELEKDFDFVRNYVTLMKLRLPTSTVIDCTIEAGDYGREPIAPLLFIPLIENVFKHGITGDKGARIEISLRAEKEQVICTTANPGETEHNRGAKTKKSAEGGIGLQNLRRRLQLIYGRDASLETSCGDGIFRTRLVINLKKS